MKENSHPVQPANAAPDLLRVAISQALKQLTAVKPIPDEAIHEARKSLKKARATLRLLVDGMNDAAYRRENIKLRDAGRLLTPLRDAKSLIDALDSLQDRYPAKLPDNSLAQLKKILHANLARARRHFHPPSGRQSAELDNCIKLLKNSLAMAQRKDIQSIEFRHIGTGLRRIYRKGRKAAAEAKADPATETLHEWRKQVKYLLNAVEGLHEGLPVSENKGNKGAKKILKRADQLADLLGNDHELAMISREIDRAEYVSVNAAVITTLHRLIDRWRAKLQKRAFKSGRKLYDQKPRQFVRRACPCVCAAPR